MKALIVGESNPYGANPDFALYPEPRGATGDRLCRLVMRLRRGQYLRAFDRVNLCHGKWSAPLARERAQSLLQKTCPFFPGGHEIFVLLGAKVTEAFGCAFVPFTIDTIRLHALSAVPTIVPLFGEPLDPLVVQEVVSRIVILPHPSGLNRLWSVAGAFDRAHALLHEAGVLPIATSHEDEAEVITAGDPSPASP